MHFDLIIIGSGGGTKLMGPAVELGLRVALIERDAIGGTCLNRGCIPSKMLIYPGEVAELAREAAALGIHNVGQPSADFAGIVTRVSAAVDKTSAALRASYSALPKVTLLQGEARFVADKTLRINGQTLTADRIFIATGCRPHIPDIPGLAGTPYMTSTEALRHTQRPKTLIIAGAGYIATELGFAYRALGSEVHLLARSRLLRHEDGDVATEFARVFSRHHQVHTGFHTERVAHQDGIFAVTGTNGEGVAQTIRGDALLVATGITPNTDNLGLEQTGIRLTPQGFIQVDAHLRTPVAGVFALGDCVGNHLFRHTVNYEGEYLARAVLRRETEAPLDYGPVPHAVFSHPQLAGVGATEEALRARGADYVVGRATYAESTPGEARLLDHGLAKILIDRATGRILGAHIVGAEAANMIHLFIALMKKSGTLADVLDMIFIHPALPEVARNAARDAARQLTQSR